MGSGDHYRGITMIQAALMKLDKISRILGKFEMAFACALLIAMVTVVGLGVFLRYVLKSPLIAGMNFATLMLIWLTFFGASFVYREKGHIAIEFVIDKLPFFLHHIVLLGVYVVVGFMLVITLVQSGHLVGVQWQQEIVALGIPRSFLSIPIFITGILMILTTLRHILEELNTITQK